MKSLFTLAAAAAVIAAFALPAVAQGVSYDQKCQWRRGVYTCEGVLEGGGSEIWSRCDSRGVCESWSYDRTPQPMPRQGTVRSPSTKPTGFVARSGEATGSPLGCPPGTRVTARDGCQ